MDDYTYCYDPSEMAGGKADELLNLVEQELLPWAQANLPVRDVSQPAHVGMLGSSLGGLLACYAGYTRPSVYGKLGCMSSSFWWSELFC